MPKRIYVGNLPFNATTDKIQDLFGQHGKVVSVSLVNDRETGRPRGFGFVEMEDGDADTAIEALDGLVFDGRNLKVNEAHPPGGGGRGGRGRDGGGGGGRRW